MSSPLTGSPKTINHSVPISFFFLCNVLVCGNEEIKEPPDQPLHGGSGNAGSHCHNEDLGGQIGMASKCDRRVWLG